MNSSIEVQINPVKIRSLLMSPTVNPVFNFVVARIETGSESAGRLLRGSKGDSDLDIHAARVCRQPPRDEPRPSPLTLLNIVNRIFRTNFKDADAIDTTATWGVIVEELKPDDVVVSTLVLRYQTGMTEKEAGRMLGLPIYKVQDTCQKAMSKLRHPCRLTRIRNSIMGWPNLYRDV